MQALIDQVLLGFLAFAESPITFGVALTLLLLVGIAIFGGVLKREKHLQQVMAWSWRIAVGCIAITLAFLAVTLLMGVAVDRRYYFLLIEFFSAAWLPSIAVALCLIVQIKARQLLNRAKGQSSL